MKHLLFIMISLCTIAISCTKEGPAGKDGFNGTNGKDGTNGINGIDGKDGTTIYSGQGTPASTIGKVGDYYMDLQNSKLFGPKSASGWGSGFNMKGADGTNGKDGVNGTNGKDGINGLDGSKILSGYGYPTALTGNIGDYYIDKNNSFLYGPKTSSSWGSAIVLRGVNGVDGKDGKDGNANVRTYMFSNPWNYYDNDFPQTGLFEFPFTGSFYLTSGEVEYGLILGFIEHGSIFSYWSQAGTTHSNSYGSNFNSSFQYSNFIRNGVYIKIGKNVLNNSGQTDWTGMEEVKSHTGITRIKIIVISQSSLSVLGYRKETIKEKDIKAIATRFIEDNK